MSASARAAIVIVSQESGTREILHREMSKRYSADYQIVACGQPAELAARMRDLRAAGLPVALVIGGVGAHDPDGIEALAAVRDIDPAALRVGDMEPGLRHGQAGFALRTPSWIISPVKSYTRRSC